MVVDFKNKYIFIGLPFTASTAILTELIETYEAQSILSKHANMPMFIKSYPNIDLSKYLIVAVLRDPIDMEFSVYNKLRTNIGNLYTDEKYFTENGGFISRKARNTSKLLRDTDMSYSDYLKYIYKNKPYSNNLSLNYKYVNFYIHFNNLSKDFTSFLNRVGIEPKRELPVKNKTAKKLEKYELTDEIKKNIFGGFYNKYKILFNVNIKISFYQKFVFNAFELARIYKWKKIDLKRSGIVYMSPDDYSFNKEEDLKV